jgi:hypothetical protein
MHPTSIGRLSLFGEFTPRFTALVEARLAIKSGELDRAGTLLDGRLREFLGADEATTQALSDALKIVVNIVYGLTSAKFDNPFRDIRNVDNIVAKRGALFMIDLKNFVKEQGFEVAHIKTDSIKIPDATPEIIEQVKLFGEKYGYTFEHEATYSKFCLVNDAVYIAKVGWAQKASKIGTWVAVGSQFQVPYVFKSLFTGEDLVFSDLCETKEVKQGSIYLGYSDENSQGRFIGRTGRFTPVVKDGFTLHRVKDGKAYAVTGTKGYLWVESELAQEHHYPDNIDYSYFQNLVEEAITTIDRFGPFKEFVN